MLNNFSLNRMLALFVTAGFGFLMIDNILEHWPVLSQEILAYIPIFFSAIGLVVGIMAVIRWNERWIRILRIFLFGAFIVAAAGLYLHNIESDEEALSPEKREHEQKEKEKPLLAPLAFGGLAAAGLLGTSRKWKAEVN